MLTHILIKNQKCVNTNHHKLNIRSSVSGKVCLALQYSKCFEYYRLAIA